MYILWYALRYEIGYLRFLGCKIWFFKSVITVAVIVTFVLHVELSSGCMRIFSQ
jgi:hypothetical protein